MMLISTYPHPKQPLPLKEKNKLKTPTKIQTDETS